MFPESLEELNAAIGPDLARLRFHKPRHRRRTEFLLLVFLAVASGFFTFLSVSAFQVAERQFTLSALAPSYTIDQNTLGVIGAAALNASEFGLSDSQEKLLGEEANQVNILILGMAGKPNPAPYLTDTILVLSIKPSTGAVALVSVPRDLLVAAPFAPSGTRINSLYQYGLARNPDSPYGVVLQKIEQLTGLQIPYWIALDLTVVTRLVDALGGVDIFLPEPIYDPQFPGPNFSYETFELPAGFQTLDGATAAKYVRSRHSFGGDFDRIQRQREIVEALARKIKDLNPLWHFSQLLAVYESLHGHLASNLEPRHGRRLYELLKDASGRDVVDLSLTSDPVSGLLKEITTPYGAAVLVPKTGFENYAAIANLFQNLFN